MDNGDGVYEGIQDGDVLGNVVCVDDDGDDRGHDGGGARVCDGDLEDGALVSLCLKKTCCVQLAD